MKTTTAFGHDRNISTLFRAAFWMSFLLLMGSQPLSARNTLVNPGIPDGERSVYNVKIGDQVSQIRETATVRTNNGRELYEFRSVSKDIDLTVWLDTQTMGVIQSVVTRKSDAVTVENTTKILKNDIVLEDNEIAVLDFISFMYVLRGFPYGKNRTYRVKTAQGGNFNLDIIWTGESVQKVGHTNIPCYQLELSLSGFWGMFFPKTVLWYSRELPHYLVRYEGLSAGPGSPPRVMELAEYSVKP